MPSFAFTVIPKFVREYGQSGVPDQRAVQDFCDCETYEEIQRLRGELTAVASGNYEEENLDLIVGIRRKTSFGSYDEWARLLLGWIAQHRK